MVKSLLKFFVYGFFIFLISGCTARTYTQVKERVDQDIAGNSGYLQGTPPSIDRSAIRKTRKTYVLEIQTKDKKKPEAEAVQPALKKAVQVSEGTVQSQTRLPGTVVEPRVVPEVTMPAAVEYTVQKNDTLQKISKKFYDTYRRWNKIYEANKDKIKDPNHVKAGTVLTIPPKE